VEEALQLQAEEVEQDRYRCDVDSSSSVGVACESFYC